MNPKRVRNLFGDFPNAHAGATADVDGQAVELVALGGEQVRARDVFDEGEIAGLLPIFVKDRREIVEKARAENRDDAGVRIEDRLARPVGARVAKRDGRNPDLFAPKQDEFFLIDFR